LGRSAIAKKNCHYGVGRNSSVSTETCYGMEGPEIESQWGARFSAPVYTGPETQTASCTMDTKSLSRG
jgi:hypothetical protein